MVGGLPNPHDRLGGGVPLKSEDDWYKDHEMKRHCPFKHGDKVKTASGRIGIFVGFSEDDQYLMNSRYQSWAIVADPMTMKVFRSFLHDIEQYR